tara:strand:+ start:684 stop:905 length:222 start_codon:yes stop_codon:yes gene_type:complete
MESCRRRGKWFKEYTATQRCTKKQKLQGWIDPLTAKMLLNYIEERTDNIMIAPKHVRERCGQLRRRSALMELL